MCHRPHCAPPIPLCLGMGITFALLSMLCFASNIFIARAAMTRMPVDVGFVVLLMVNVAFTMTVFGAELLLRHTPFVFHWKAAGWFMLSGVIAIYLGRRMLLDAVRVLGPARASVLHSSSPMITLVAAWVLVGERLGAYELGLMAMVILGLWATQLPGRGAVEGPRSDGEALKRGAMLGLMMVAGFGVGNAVRGLAMRSWSEAIFGSLLGTAAALACQLASIRDWPKALHTLRSGDRKGLALYALCGIATSGGSIFTSYAMNYVEIAIATLITFTTPLVVFPVSVLVLKNREGLTLRTAAGAATVLAGIVLLALR
jgi:drug/metabolite transporter (DMT)-like permease